MTAKIQIVDRGRGLQLSTSRITVKDLAPYFQECAARSVCFGEIHCWSCSLETVVSPFVMSFSRLFWFASNLATALSMSGFFFV